MNNLLWDRQQLVTPSKKQATIIPLETYTEELKININLTLGNAQANCTGAGICKITASRPGPGIRSTCQVCWIPAVLTKIDQQCLLLIVDKRTLTIEQIKKHFLATHICLHRPMRLPKRLASKLDFAQPPILLPKAYKLFRDGPFFHNFLDYHLE